MSGIEKVWKDLEAKFDDVNYTTDTINFPDGSSATMTIGQAVTDAQGITTRQVTSDGKFGKANQQIKRKFKKEAAYQEVCWVADQLRVFKLRGSDGKVLLTLGEPTVQYFLIQLAVDLNSADCWFADYGWTSRVYRVRSSDGAMLIPGGVYFSSLSPNVLSVNSTTHECWVSYYNSYIIKLKDDGTPLASAFVGTTPQGVSIDPNTNVCWVADQTQKRFLRLNSEGNIISPDITGMNSPRWVSVNTTTNDCWLADFGANKVYRYKDDGVTKQAEYSLLNGPTCVSVNPNTGDCWVADYNGNRVVRLKDDGTQLAEKTGLNHPSRVSVNPETGDCWVTDYSNNRVLKLKNNGDILLEVTTLVDINPGVSHNPATLSAPNSIAVNPKELSGAKILMVK
jgi:hypothetical protein